MESNALNIAANARLKKNLAPGTRITVRGEEWVVRDCTQELELADARVVRCEGVSGFLRGVSATFVDSFDHIEVVDPLDIDFVVDKSTKFRDSKLWIDIWARKVVPIGNSLAIGHRAVVDALPYQRVPTAMALDISRNLRPRILIADAVGLGKTIEVGILLSELIKRGRAERILVVVLKSMMTQFQKELWSRFAIPLEAIDRTKLESIARNIPRSMNPLSQVDRVIISMDTLKTKHCIQMLESSRWDVVIVDECHNVARRGGSGSQRSRLAKQLAKISDTLILTSATPHDGTSASYASLLELLDPLLVVDPDKITKADLEPVTIQRYAKDTRTGGHKERREHKHHIKLDDATLSILAALVGKAFDSVRKDATRFDVLFRTTMSKALMSSPEAFKSTVEERLKKKKKEVESDLQKDNELLKNLLNQVEKISIRSSAKFLHLMELLNNTIPQRSRVVIFTESRKTITALSKAISTSLSLHLSEDENVFDSKAQIVVFHGGQSETTQNDILADFQTKGSKIRFLIATDVASEGINLHYFCNHLIHYDIPWSLITISQRNGRIDRYGQIEHPEIHYLIGHTDDPKAARLSESRVVDILVEKAKYAEQALGNVGISLGVYDADKEVEKVARQVASDDPLDLLFAEEAPEFLQTIEPKMEAIVADSWRPFAANDLSFTTAAIKFLGLPTGESIDASLTLLLEEDESKIRAMIKSLQQLDRELDLKRSPSLTLTTNQDVMKASISESRSKSGKWPKISLGWEIHPSIETLSRLVEARFDKKEARVLRFESQKGKGFLSFLIYRALYDHTGHPIFCTLQMAFPESGGWRLVEPGKGYQEIGLTSATINADSALTKANEKQLHEHAKSLHGDLTKRCQIDAESARGSRDGFARQEESRANQWYGDRKRYLEERFSLALHSRRRSSELQNLEDLKETHRDFIDRYRRIEESNLFFRIVAAYWGG